MSAVGSRTEVSVYRGAVRFGPWRLPALDLWPGDRVTLENGRLNRTPGAPAGRQPHWFDGWFDAGDASLGQLVEEADFLRAPEAGPDIRTQAD
jgi:ferric-dicitrate binding protein FerR (iron transport regulator)